MPLMASMAYPNSTLMVMDGLEASTRTEIATALIRPSVPQNYDWTQRLIVARRIGGGPDEDDVTDYPVIQVACCASSWLQASAMQADVQVEIMSWPMSFVGPNQILVDEAEIFVGEQEIPDIYPDERRVVATYRLGLRRQFRP